MKILRPFLIISTILIFAITIYAAFTKGINWPAVYFGDLLNIDWRTQFNADFLIHLILLATWIWWREGGGRKGIIYGFLSIFLGGMFTFPYLLLETYRAKGQPESILLGVHKKRATNE